jgi:hypothetical protein
VRVALRAAHAFRREPYLIVSLVVIAMDAIAIEDAERWLIQGSPSSGALQRVEEALRAEADPKRVEMALVGERCCCISTWRASIRGSNFIAKMYHEGSLLQILDALDAHIRSARRPYPECLLAAARLRDTLEAKIPFYYPVSGQFTEALGRFCLVHQRSVARLESAHVAFAALRYKAKHGRLPEKLQDLVPDFVDAVPLDPFDGKPLRYRADGERFVVYSVHENARDDGGDIAHVTPEWPDIGFGFRWPKKGRR